MLEMLFHKAIVWILNKIKSRTIIIEEKKKANLPQSMDTLKGTNSFLLFTNLIIKNQNL